MKLSQKHAIITGASLGFGFAVARAFVEEGSSIALCARNVKQLQQAQEELAALAPGKSRVYAIPADVAQSHDVRRFVQTAIEELGGIDILVGNAGVYGPKGLLEEVDWEEWEQALHVNL